MAVELLAERAWMSGVICIVVALIYIPLVTAVMERKSPGRIGQRAWSLSAIVRRHRDHEW
jgi:hypothetical protein